MRTNKKNILSFFLSTLLLLIFTGCSSRVDKPITNADSTIVYPAKKANGISAKITLCRKMNTKTGKQIGEGNVFTIMEKEKLRAFIEIENRFSFGNKELMFHIDWIGENGRSFYRKQFILAPDDSTTVIKSSISISPEIRQTGKYTLRVYFFRELISEKKFEIFPKFRITPFSGEGTTGNITLCRKVDTKTGKQIGEDTVFTIKKNANIRAFFDLENRFVFGDRELMFRFDWIEEDNKSFFKKQFNLSANDTSSTIFSSISISPEKRKTGKYSLRIYLFNELIAVKNFKLITEPGITLSKSEEKIKAKIILYRKLNKKTGNRIGEGILFSIKEKERVRAYIEIKNCNSNRKLKFHLNWIGPNGKSFYSKKFDISSGDSTSTIKSSISISPNKRKAGKYTLQIFLFNKLIGEKKFELSLETNNIFQ